MYKRYSEGIRLFGKTAIEQKGGPFQRELLRRGAEMDGSEFVDWLDEKIADCLRGSEAGVFLAGEEPPLPPEPKMTAGVFLNPPESVMAEWHDLWRGVPMGDASSYGFWGYVTRRMIEEEKIHPSYLFLRDAPNNGSSGEDVGRDKIREALDGGAQAMDGCVRNFCRHLSGLFAARGTRSVYVDCCLARAWWKCHVSQSAGGKDWRQSILPAVREGGVWGNLGEKMASRLTIIGDVNIRNGIIRFLASEEGKWCRAKDPLTSLLLRVGARTSWCAMGIFNPDEMRAQIAEIAGGAGA